MGGKNSEKQVGLMEAEQQPGLLLALSQINQHPKRVLIMNKRKKREKIPDGGFVRRFFSTVWYALTDGGL